jgi:hypothetical protein
VRSGYASDNDRKAKNKKHLGGMKMKKMKLLAAILFCLGIAGVVSAREVVSIDLTAYGNNTIAYSGLGAVDGNFVQVWRPYDGEQFGKVMGSPRTYHLADENEPCRPSTFAAQVWIGVDANSGSYSNFGSVTQSALMDDGFVNTSGTPLIRLWGKGSYGGFGRLVDPCTPNPARGVIDPNFDIYVYGPAASNFTLTCYDMNCTPGRTQTQSISGGFNGSFILGQNYVVFSDVNIHFADPCYPTQGYVTISFTTKISGLQLVKRRDPFEITQAGTDSGYTIMPARAWDTAFWMCRMDDGTHYGVDMSEPCQPWHMPFGMVINTDRRSGCGYDINVAPSQEGVYNFDANVAPLNGPYPSGSGDQVYLDIFLDDANMGYVAATDLSNIPYYTSDPGPIPIKLFKGKHTLRWMCGELGYQPLYGFNIANLRLKYVGPVTMVDCNEVYKYGYQYAHDFAGAYTGPYDPGHDCHVDLKDLAVIANNWLSCYDPNDPNCPR